MRSVLKFFTGLVALSAVSGSAFAGGAPLAVPEPGSIALVGVAIAALAVVSRKGKK